MLLEKPSDVRHENAAGTACAIYGVDAHPSKAILATAGGDNTVKIWSLAPAQDEDGASFELLATLAFHEQAVNCVRWAVHGRYLASGSDDYLVHLYELQPGAPPPVPFGSNAKPNKQNWTRCATLKRHTMEVQDLAWSPDDRMLATCSIDNTILIWDVGVAGVSEVMTQPLQTLTGHSGWVKGVAWDPVGKYLSSAGEDKTVRMWRVEDWQPAEVVSEPFQSCASTSHFRRLSWSPDGSALCATHAFKSKKNIAALLNRSTWSDEVKFVGHQGIVTCARFNPKLLVSPDDLENEYACCAVGGEDATVSIWLAHLARPIAVIKNCFDASVTDLSWSTNQSLLIACGLDGTICCFHFEGNEIGAPISDADQSKLLQSKYGSRAGITLASTLVENPIQLQMEERSSKDSPSAVSATPVMQSAPQQQQPTVLVPKKKKKLATTQSVNALQLSKNDKKRIAPTLQADVSASAHTNPASSQNNIRNILSPMVPSPTAADASLMASRLENQSATGFSQPSSSDVNVVSVRSKSSAVGTNGTTPAVRENGSGGKISASKPAPEGGSLKRKRDGERAAAAQAATAKTREVVPQAPAVLNESGASAWTSSEPLLPEFPLRLQFVVDISTDSSQGARRLQRSNTATPKVSVEVTVHNLKNPTPEEIVELGPVFSTISCTEGSNVKWADRVAGRAVAVVGNATFCAVAVSNGDLYILSPNGRRLFPCIALGSPIAVIECSPGQSSYLVVILASGAIKIWDVKLRKLTLSNSIEPITHITSSDYPRLTLLRCQVTGKGQPIITFAKSNPDTRGGSSLVSFTFDSAMESWMRVADDNFSFSDFASALPTDAVSLSSVPVGPLRRLQNASGYNRTHRGSISAMLSGMSDALVQRNVTRSHLEHQIAAALALKSSTEYRYWIRTYVKFLAQDEDVSRLDDLCAEMMGPFHAPSRNEPSSGQTSDSLWAPMVLDMGKREVLKTHILLTMATNRSLQRVVTRYQLMLSEIDEREKEEEPAVETPAIDAPSKDDASPA